MATYVKQPNHITHPTNNHTSPQADPLTCQTRSQWQPPTIKHITTRLTTSKMATNIIETTSSNHYSSATDS